MLVDNSTRTTFAMAKPLLQHWRTDRVELQISFMGRGWAFNGRGILQDVAYDEGAATVTLKSEMCTLIYNLRDTMCEYVDTSTGAQQAGEPAWNYDHALRFSRPEIDEHLSLLARRAEDAPSIQRH